MYTRVGLPPCNCNVVLGVGDYCYKAALRCPRLDGDEETCNSGFEYGECDIEQAPKLGSGSERLLLNDTPCTGQRLVSSCRYDFDDNTCYAGGTDENQDCPGFKKTSPVQCE